MCIRGRERADGRTAEPGLRNIGDLATALIGVVSPLPCFRALFFRPLLCPTPPSPSTSSPVIVSNVFSQLLPVLAAASKALSKPPLPSLPRGVAPLDPRSRKRSRGVAGFAESSDRGAPSGSSGTRLCTALVEGLLAGARLDDSSSSSLSSSGGLSLSGGGFRTWPLGFSLGILAVDEQLADAHAPGVPPTYLHAAREREGTERGQNGRFAARARHTESCFGHAPQVYTRLRKGRNSRAYSETPKHTHILGGAQEVKFL
jgi:hypothetical protein